MSPVDHPDRYGHRKWTLPFSGGQDVRYLSDDPVTPMACAEQYQFCAITPNGDSCSTLSGMPYDFKELNITRTSDIREAAILLLKPIKDGFGRILALNLQINSLAREGIVDSKIPETHWISEIANWESTLWSALQIGVSDHAVEQRQEILEKGANPTGFIQLCGAQRMRKNGGFVNINVFGLAFIVTVSCLAAIVDITLLKFLIYISGFRQALSPRIERWIQDGILQLQRRAYEAQGASTLTSLDKDVPVTVGNDKLPELSVETLPPHTHTIGIQPTRSRSTALDGRTVPLLATGLRERNIVQRLVRRSASF